MTDAEFEQAYRDIAAAIAATPGTHTVTLPPGLAEEFEKRGAKLTWT